MNSYFNFSLLLSLFAIGSLLGTPRASARKQTERAKHERVKSHAKNQSGNIYEQEWVLKKVKSIMAGMTLDDKVNQLFFLQGSANPVPNDPINQPAYVYATQNNIGGFSFFGTPFGPGIPGGDNTLVTNTREARKKQIDTINGFANTKIPLFFGTDFTHAVSANESVQFPQPHSFQTIFNDEIEEIAFKEAQWIAFAAQETGINLSFAPTAITAFNRRFGRVFESASDRSEKVARFCAGFVRGLQSIETVCVNGESRRFISGLIASTKHFLGDGSAVLTNSPLNGGNVIDLGNAVIPTAGTGDFNTFFENNGAGFVSGIQEETGVVMMSFNFEQYNQVANTGQPPYAIGSTFNPQLYEILRASPSQFPGIALNHRGIILSNSESPLAEDIFPTFFTPESYYALWAYFISLGGDLMLQRFRASDFDFPVDNVEFYYQLRDYIKNTVELSRINDAVSHVLAVKVVAGLFDQDPPRIKKSHFPEAAVLDAFNQAFKSLIYTLPAQNQGLLLATQPIIPSVNSPILLLGRESDIPDSNGKVQWNAFYDDIGLLCGGWSIFSSTFGVTGDRTISNNEVNVPIAPDAVNVNQLFQNLRSLKIPLPGTNNVIGGASTILDGFHNIGVNPVVFNRNQTYPANSVAVMVLGEFAYQETAGEIDNLGFGSCPVFDITITPDTSYNPLEGIKLSALTYANLKAAYKAGIPVVTVLLGSRDQTSWNYFAPLNVADTDPFGQMSITDVSTAIVYALLPGTSGGDAIVQFLYNTPLKLGNHNQALRFNWPLAPAYLPGTNPPGQFCGSSDPAPSTAGTLAVNQMNSARSQSQGNLWRQ